MSNTFDELITYPSDLSSVKTDYFNVFTNKLGGSNYYHFNFELSNFVRQTPEMKNFIKEVGNKINAKLKLIDGNYQLLNKPIELTVNDPIVIGPQWEDWKSNINGTHILIGNTEQSFVYTLDYTYNTNSKEWEGEFFFRITDNFGLDKEDCVEKSWMGYLPYLSHILKGFESWWMLQKDRCYTPFITDIRVVAKIKGKL